MSEEQIVRDIFDLHKRWVEDGIATAKDSAVECNPQAVLQHFYRAVLALKGLEAVFTKEIPEVSKYVTERKATIIKQDIPELAGALKKCMIHK